MLKIYMLGSGPIAGPVLEKLLESFEKGRQYTEKEVNLILADFNDDFCTLRREMIAENLMERDHGTYWVKE